MRSEVYGKRDPNMERLCASVLAHSAGQTAIDIAWVPRDAASYKSLMDSLITVLSDELPAIPLYIPQEIFRDFTGLSESELPEMLEKRLLRIRRVILFIRPDISSDTIFKAITWMAENVDTGFSLPDVTKHCYLNRYYFSSLFHEATGIRYCDYAKIMKVERAKILLTGPSRKQTVAIAATLGFRDPQYFSDMFREVTGVRPAKYQYDVEDDLKNYLPRLAKKKETCLQEGAAAEN
ncbi:MAG: AraC family transcriptional regulator [Lachnospiraceae bacterium]